MKEEGGREGGWVDAVLIKVVFARAEVGWCSVARASSERTGWKVSLTAVVATAFCFRNYIWRNESRNSTNKRINIYEIHYHSISLFSLYFPFSLFCLRDKCSSSNGSSMKRNLWNVLVHNRKSPEYLLSTTRTRTRTLTVTTITRPKTSF